MEPTFDFLEAIALHSRGFADACEGNLDAPVTHCPGWCVADLVHHLTTTHWFWATIVEERLDAPPPEVRRPPRAQRHDAIARFRTGAEHLVEVLRSAPWSDRVYTWASAQDDVAFVARHQVQEAAVHHWDACRAAGRELVIAPSVALDSIEEFLTFSVSSSNDPAEPARAPLRGSFVLRARDADVSWSVFDGTVRGTVAYERGALPALPVISASASELLLWLYGRVDVDTSSVDADLLRRFRELCFTD